MWASDGDSVLVIGGNEDSLLVFRMSLTFCVLQTAEECPNNRRSGRLQPPDGSDHLSGFSRGLTPCSFDTHQGTRFLSHSAVCVALINFNNTNDQTGAEALNLCRAIGRLKPPASTVAPAFFQRSVKPDLLPA